MADTFRIWIEINHHAAFRSGGWAYVVAEGSALTGAAGGERSGSAERIALAGLVEALKGLPAAIAVEIASSSPLVAGVPRRLAAFSAGEDPPADDLDLWALLTTALKDRPARFGGAAIRPRTPAAFAAAWAELARDKVKARGAFTAPIPRANLAKAGV